MKCVANDAVAVQISTDTPTICVCDAIGYVQVTTHPRDLCVYISIRSDAFPLDHSRINDTRSNCYLEAQRRCSSKVARR